MLIYIWLNDNSIWFREKRKLHEQLIKSTTNSKNQDLQFSDTVDLNV